MTKLLLMIIYMTLLVAEANRQIPWQEGNGHKVSWAMDCDFWTMDDLAKIQSSAEDCSGHCLRNAECNRFTWTDGQCILKKMNGIPTHEGSPTRRKGAVCGFVRSRVPEPFPDVFHLYSDWHCVCRELQELD